MTVKELITELQKSNPESKIEVANRIDEESVWYNIECISISATPETIVLIYVDPKPIMSYK